MSHPEYDGTAEAARKLGVSVRTVHRLVAAGKLKTALKLPGDTGAYLFHPRDLDRYLKRHDYQRDAYRRRKGAA
jgi:excisionase family DNA binding protein